MPTLYGLGVGPGDPELITLKALKILKEVPVILAPKSRQEGESLALEIVARVLGPAVADKETVELHFPMTRDPARLAGAWREAAGTAAGHLRRGRDVAFVTLGDPTFYSTYFLLLEELTRLVPEVTVVTVPGVTSVSACAARLNLPLVQGDESLAVVSGARDPEALRRLLADFDCTVVLKVGRHLVRLKEILKDLGLEERAVLATRCGLPGERLGSPAGTEEADYLSLLVVKK
ncbi:MAG: precorrin-2 C(20)-methyltransferase [Desulfotomaculales bacterium]